MRNKSWNLIVAEAKKRQDLEELVLDVQRGLAGHSTFLHSASKLPVMTLIEPRLTT